MRLVLLALIALLVVPASGYARFEGRAAPWAQWGLESDGTRYVSFERESGERRITTVIDSFTDARLHLRTPVGCATDQYDGAGMTAVGGSRILWNCLPDPGIQSAHNANKEAWLFDLRTRTFSRPAGMAELRERFYYVGWAGVGERWVAAGVDDGDGHGPGGVSFLNHVDGRVVDADYPPRTDRASNLDNDAPLQTLCDGLHRTVIRDRDGTWFTRPFDFEGEFAITSYDAGRRYVIRLQRCGTRSKRIGRCRPVCSDIQLGAGFVTWWNHAETPPRAYAYSIRTGRKKTWALTDDEFSVVHTRDRLYVLDERTNRIRSVALPG